MAKHVINPMFPAQIWRLKDPKAAEIGNITTWYWQGPPSGGEFRESHLAVYKPQEAKWRPDGCNIVPGWARLDLELITEEELRKHEPYYSTTWQPLYMGPGIYSFMGQAYNSIEKAEEMGRRAPKEAGFFAVLERYQHNFPDGTSELLEATIHNGGSQSPMDLDWFDERKD